MAIASTARCRLPGARTRAGEQHASGFMLHAWQYPDEVDRGPLGTHGPPHLISASSAPSETVQTSYTLRSYPVLF